MERPSSLVINPAPSTVANTTDVNASALRLSLTNRNTGRSTNPPPTTTAKTPATALAAVARIAVIKPSICWKPVHSVVDKSGTKTRRGTTAMSWSNKTPKAAVAYRLDCSFLSARSCSTNADDDRDKEVPMTRDSDIPAPIIRAPAASAVEVRAICNVPRPNA